VKITTPGQEYLGKRIWGQRATGQGHWEQKDKNRFPRTR